MGNAEKDLPKVAKSQKGFVSKRCHRGANKVKRKHEENGAPRGTVLCDEAIVLRVLYLAFVVAES